MVNDFDVGIMLQSAGSAALVSQLDVGEPRGRQLTDLLLQR